MTDVIIIAIVVLIIAFAVYKTVKHFKGEGECCGGASYKARRKKLKNVAEKLTLMVEGMSCQNCVNRVMENVNSIPGASAAVHLKKGEVVVSMDHHIADEIIVDAIESAGFTVTEVK
ncbi:MAG: heavy-metal-associated domain-containing protein [Oscillospiraceae bacterium]|nr:heavy-metal-associated domain-containing protein [Oscillospiraceae bacterium]